MGKPRSFGSLPKKSQSTKSLQAAVAHLNAGRVQEAEFIVRLALVARPDDGDALNLLGGIALQRGNYVEALKALERAATVKPRDAGIHFNLAGVYRRCGRLEDALAHYEAAGRLRSGYTDAEALKGEVLRERGDWQRAAAAYDAALQYDAKSIVALNGRGLCRAHDENHEPAVKDFSAALDCVPPHDNVNRSRVLANLGSALLQAGAGRDGLSALAEAVTLAPANDEFVVLLARNLRHVRVIPEDDAFARILVRLFEHKDVDPRGIASAAALALRANAKVWGALDVLSSSSVADPLHSEALRVVSLDELLLAHLRNAPITDAALERALTSLRRRLILEVAGTGAAAVELELTCALARQCFLNEYVWSLTAEEEAAVGSLFAKTSFDQTWRTAAVLACYRPLVLPVGRDSATAPRPLAAIIRQQVDEPAEERALAASVLPLTKIADPISASVRMQYEENPYPRWVRTGPRTPRPFRNAIRDRLPHVPEELLPRTDTPRVLIAGCGTGLETMQVINSFEVASVLAVDLSRASLGYASRKLKNDAVNVQHRQADILELDDFESRFDMVHSFGVIHHMADPRRGLAILTRALEPGGFLFLGLYSRIARRPLITARDLIAARGIATTPEAIRGFRREIFAGQVSCELSILASPASDFWTMSECRDLMFHVEEHHFTLAEINAMFAAEGLAFLGLEVSYAPDLVRFRKQHSSADLMSLTAWHAYEEQHPLVFGGTYRLWARKIVG